MNLKPLVNDKSLWESFLSEIDERINKAQDAMSNARDVEDMLRYQGEVRSLKKLKQLRDKVNGPSESS